MEVQDPFESKRTKFRPDYIKILFVAEAPPALDSKRFFYFVSVTRGDSLFLETMKVLYPGEFASTPEVRRRKADFLEHFKNDGFYLIDACRRPFPKGARRSTKERMIRQELPLLKTSLVELWKSCCDSITGTILIGRAVYNVCSSALSDFNVLNREMIDFPASGGQKKFRRKLSLLLKKDICQESP